jgi:hypothetical protein
MPWLHAAACNRPTWCAPAVAHPFVRVQLFMHMSEADVPPLLQDCAALISSISIDGKWILAEMLFYYIFRHEAAFEPPPPLSHSELKTIPSRELNVAYMLQSATQQARAVYCPGSPHPEQGALPVPPPPLMHAGHLPPFSDEPSGAIPPIETMPAHMAQSVGKMELTKALSVKSDVDAVDPTQDVRPEPSAHSAPTLQRNLAALRTLASDPVPQTPPGQPFGRRTSAPTSILGRLNERCMFQTHGGKLLGQSGAARPPDTAVSAVPTLSVSSGSLMEVTASLAKVTLAQEVGWPGSKGWLPTSQRQQVAQTASHGLPPLHMATHLPSSPAPGTDDNVLSCEVMCCNELLAAYMRIDKLDRAAHLLQCMLKCAPCDLCASLHANSSSISACSSALAVICEHPCTR